MEKHDPALVKVVANRGWDCRACGLGEAYHNRDSPELKGSLPHEWEDWESSDHQWEITICAGCGDQVQDIPHVARRKQEKYIGPVFHSYCQHVHYWRNGYRGECNCVRCDLGYIEYLETLLKAANIAFEQEMADGKDYDMTGGE